MNDWTTARVVRDRLGGLMGRRGNAWRGLDASGLHDFTVAEMEVYAAEYGPLIPVLDAEGLPVVRTVGDLTIRQLRVRPQVLLRVGDDVGTLYAGPKLGLLTVDGRMVDVDLDTPCEVLP